MAIDRYDRSLRGHLPKPERRQSVSLKMSPTKVVNFSVSGAANSCRCYELMPAVFAVVAGHAAYCNGRNISGKKNQKTQTAIFQLLQVQPVRVSCEQSMCKAGRLTRSLGAECLSPSLMLVLIRQRRRNATAAPLDGSHGPLRALENL